MKSTTKKINQCKYCGCTDNCACAGGCYWTDQARTICSACANQTTNVFDDLLEIISYEEFITQLIMFEKRLSRTKASKIAVTFIESDIPSIFDMEQFFEEVEE